MSECYKFVRVGCTCDILTNSNLTNKNDLFEYKFQTAQWVQWKFTGQEPFPHSAQGAAIYDDKLWIFAGYDGNTRVNDMWNIHLEIQICGSIRSEEAFDSLLRYICCGDTNIPIEDSLYLFQSPIYYGFTNNRLQVFGDRNLQSNVSPENVVAILQAADRTRAADIKEYALKMIRHHFQQVARQDVIKNLARPLLAENIWALAKTPREEAPLPLQPRSLPSPSSADTVTDDPDYTRHRCN